MSILLRIIITILSIISLIAILIFSYSIYYYFSRRTAIEYAFLNKKGCGKIYCTSKIKDLSIPIQKDDKFNIDVAKYCTDLILRVEKAEEKALPEPKGLTKILNLWNTKLEPLFGVLWWDSVKKVAYIIFRGTYNITEWIEDFNYNQESLPKIPTKNNQVLFDLGPVVQKMTNKPMIHDGFLEIYTKFQQDLLAQLKILSPNQIIISGHSMGAAIATICGIDIIQISDYPNPIVYNFASPRIGNFEFSEFVKTLNLKVYRIVNTLDVIPQLPPPICPNFNNPKQPYYFDHCGEAKYFTGNWKSIVNNHLMAAYIQGLDNLS